MLAFSRISAKKKLLKVDRKIVRYLFISSTSCCDKPFNLKYSTTKKFDVSSAQNNSEVVTASRAYLELSHTSFTNLTSKYGSRLDVNFSELFQSQESTKSECSNAMSHTQNKIKSSLSQNVSASQDASLQLSQPTSISTLDIPLPPSEPMDISTSDIPLPSSQPRKNSTLQLTSQEVIEINCLDKKIKQNNELPFSVDKRPSKVYIDMDRYKRSRQNPILEKQIAKCGGYQPNSLINELPAPSKNLMLNVSSGRRSHFKVRSKEPTLINLSDDDDEIVCLTPTISNAPKAEVVSKTVERKSVTIEEKSIEVNSEESNNSHAKIQEVESSVDPNIRCELSQPTDKNLAMSPENRPGQLVPLSINFRRRIKKVDICQSKDKQHSKCFMDLNAHDNGVFPIHETEKDLDSSTSRKQCTNMVNAQEDITELKPSEPASLSRTPNNNRNPLHFIGRLEEVDSDFVPLERIAVEDVTNREIDIDDEVLATREKLESLRSWEHTNFAHKYNTSREGYKDTMLTLLNYNVLGQQLLQDHMELYRYCSEEHLNWKYRWTLLQHEIKNIDPDIVTLQEVQGNHYHEYFLPWFTHLNYVGLYKKRTGDKSDGCAIFIRKDMFKVLESVSVEYMQPQTFLDRDNVGLICRLQDVKTGLIFCVATTHLLYNPRRYDIKLCQMQMFLTEIDRISYQHNFVDYNCPIIITGDFNAEPHTPLIKYLKDGFVFYEGMSNKTLTPYSMSGGFFLDKILLPIEIGISNFTEHIQALREVSSHLSLKEKRALQVNVMNMYHSEKQNHNYNNTVYPQQQTGRFEHRFGLKSVYKHTLRRMRGVPEVTTQGTNYETVDYIMYSQIYDRRISKFIEGNIKLYAKLGLLSASEARKFGPMPSAVCPSDHFPLAAKFVLKKPRYKQPKV